MFCEMKPVIEDSVVQTTESSWLIGSSIICESNLATPPDGALAHWTSNSGTTFYLRKYSGPYKLKGEDVSVLSQINRVHKAGTGAAVWAFGGVHIKAKAWIPGLQSESEAIRYVKEHTRIPVPSVIFAWIDVEWNRSFVILESMKGQTLYHAWARLSTDQKSRTAEQIAEYCADLALSTSFRMETLGGQGVREDWLTRNPLPSEPSWKPFIQGPFTVEELKAYVQDDSLAAGPKFYLYHADLGPTNIILDESNQQIVAVIDWESLAFYPHFWIGTKPLFSAGFNLGGTERSAWAFLLSSALENRGFQPDANLYRRWKATVKELLPVI